MTNAVPILSVRGLSIDYRIEGRRDAYHAVVDLSFDLYPGRALALVGESGCGKTTTMLSLLRLLPAAGQIIAGQVLFHGQDLLQLSEAGIRAVRWKQMAIVFQGAMNALNPVRRVEDQIVEVLLLHGTVGNRRQAKARVADLMQMVGIPPQRAQQYPHQFSGGMRQRAMIAMALACEPEVLIADEPTTALDVMIQAQIITLLESLQQMLGLSVILVTHDLGVVAEMCTDVLIMQDGRAIEQGTVDTIFNAPRHAYTQRLLATIPKIGLDT
ncbi:MAG: ABC transporter ATP-binding protein [Chloroflexi bacterium]|nr:ABC transporter ATP-binding protein [Chloroflexota bacterium]